ncbi:hypothetical protein K438DRAFT_1863962 [Mycena galopus ATCC 62051]|nr:hypothetical protein K438DRAFT_1863962 [Mycena galopus ATCC 62051]
MTPLRTLYIAIALSFISVAQAQQPSAAPSCTPSCPAQDNAGFDLGDHSDSTGVLFCSYPAFAGENEDDFDCTYNDATGNLITDNDAGFCPGSAPVSCHSRRFKGDDNYTALMRKRQAATEARARRSEPRQVKARKPSVAL